MPLILFQRKFSRLFGEWNRILTTSFKKIIKWKKSSFHYKWSVIHVWNNMAEGGLDIKTWWSQLLIQILSDEFCITDDAELSVKIHSLIFPVRPSLSEGSSLFVLMVWCSDGLIPLQKKPIRFPTNAESQAGPKQRKEGRQLVTDLPRNEINRCVQSSLPLLCSHSLIYKTCFIDLRLKGLKSDRPQDIQWRGLATSQCFCSTSLSPSCGSGEAWEWFQE